jgi:putative Holliday junction resolvase
MTGEHSGDHGRGRAATRILGVDLGSSRIGLALSDPTTTVATPHSVLQRSGDVDADRRAIVAAARESDAATIVVGLPVSLSGRKGPAARGALDEIKALRAIAEPLGIGVDTCDERLTTVIAHRYLADTKVKGRARRRVVDDIAAAVMLQSYLDRRR